MSTTVVTLSNLHLFSVGCSQLQGAETETDLNTTEGPAAPARQGCGLRVMLPLGACPSWLQNSCQQPGERASCACPQKEQLLPALCLKREQRPGKVPELSMSVAKTEWRSWTVGMGVIIQGLPLSWDHLSLPSPCRERWKDNQDALRTCSQTLKSTALAFWDRFWPTGGTDDAVAVSGPGRSGLRVGREDPRHFT